MISTNTSSTNDESINMNTTSTLSPSTGSQNVNEEESGKFFKSLYYPFGSLMRPIYCDFCEENVFLDKSIRATGIPLMFLVVMYLIMEGLHMGLDDRYSVHILYRLLLALLTAAVYAIFYVLMWPSLVYRCKECNHWVCHPKGKVRQKKKEFEDPEEMIEIEYVKKEEEVYCDKCKENRSLYLYGMPNIKMMIIVQVIHVLSNLIYAPSQSNLSAFLYFLRMFMLFVSSFTDQKIRGWDCYTCKRLILVYRAYGRIEVDRDGVIIPRHWAYRLNS